MLVPWIPCRMAPDAVCVSPLHVVNVLVSPLRLVPDDHSKSVCLIEAGRAADRHFEGAAHAASAVLAFAVLAFAAHDFAARQPYVLVAVPVQPPKPSCAFPLLVLPFAPFLLLPVGLLTVLFPPPLALLFALLSPSARMLKVTTSDRNRSSGGPHCWRCCRPITLVLMLHSRLASAID